MALPQPWVATDPDFVHSTLNERQGHPRRGRHRDHHKYRQFGHCQRREGKKGQRCVPGRRMVDVQIGS